ncbi:DinB family protein [Aureisphaera galaxeae]|uniref:DinB family protein n=1 Tax=Aureisphaera galaxeae TaxID=1538023 RepID=UPI00235058F8|nr:DinB family protein [Aureisphaera galaxeae]MDC8004888.1 DinB family protein [Aureisphaera galaxeae]
MKNLMLPIFALLIMGFTTTEQQLTQAERDFAVEEMTKTYDHLLKTIKGLSEAQLNFKSSPESWSIAECTEHITISENNIFGMLQGALANEPDPSKRSEVKMTDAQILQMIPDRSQKVKTAKPFEPTGQFGSHKVTVKEFKAKRKSNIKFVKSTEEDLRNRYTELPFGTIDAYQILLFMSAHTDRHISQIKEVMAHADFPKK